MSNISIPAYMPCYFADSATGKSKLGKLDYPEFRALLEKREAEAKSSSMKIGTESLTPEELKELADQYSPTHMSQAEYSSFIDRLVNKGVLGQDEIYDIGLDRLMIRPGEYTWGCIAPNLSKSDLSLRTLAEANGNALHWTSIMAQWRGGSSKSVKVTADAYQKVNNILAQMQEQRRQTGFKA